MRTLATIDEPGVYDLPAEVYHRDPVEGGSLSSSGARRLMATCPAKFHYEQQNPLTPSAEMNLGTAAHRLVLGVGNDLVRIDADDYRTKAARADRDDAIAAGQTPLLPHEWDTVHAMAEALRGHELASALLGGDGAAERTLIWQDKPTRVWRRSLVDWLPAPVPDGVMYVADYKTAASAHPDAISKSMETYGYHAQAAWYSDGLVALGLAREVKFFLVVQEKDPPYLVSPVQPDALAIDAGRLLNRQALDLYAHCRATDTWPAYVEGVEPVSLPPWAEARYMQEIGR